MTEAVELSCRKFAEVLASDAPAPGGGGAAALMGAIGMALGNMVGSLTVDKPKYAIVSMIKNMINPWVVSQLF